jgi:predicted NUDIX family NTP pyrophosphohydrolase
MLMYRINARSLEYFLIHPGGPYYKNKREGYWSIPKGIPDEGEDLLVAAQREFSEETGIRPSPPFLELGTSKTKAGKTIHVWAFEGNWKESDGIISNTFTMEWPPRSGKMIDVPEADQGHWFSYSDAIVFINERQKIFLDRLREQKSYS